MKKCFLTIFLLFFVFSVNAYAEKVSDNEIELKFNFGNRTGGYSGEMENGLPHGFGKFESENQDGVKWFYEGSFAEGHFDGKGITVFENGEEKLDGTYKNDYMNGYGKYYKGGNIVYEGEWLDGEYFGEGKLYEGNKTWIGTFNRGILNGQGSYYIDDSLRSSGEWKNGAFWNGKTYNENGEWTKIKNGNVDNTLLTVVLLVFLGIIIGLPIMGVVLYKFAKRPAKVKIKPQDNVKKCPHCGSPNKVISGKVIECEYCGSTLK